MNTAAEMVAVPVTVPKRQYTAAQRWMALALVVFGYFYIRLFLFETSGLGRTLFVWLLLGASAAYMAHEKIRPNAAAVVSGALTGALAVTFALIPSDALTVCTALFCQLGYTYFAFKSTDTSIEKRPGERFAFDMVKAVLGAPLASFGALFPALFSTSGNRGDTRRRMLRTAGFVLLGLLCSAVPTAPMKR